MSKKPLNLSFNRCDLDPDQLFGLEEDPQETRNLADEPQFESILEDLKTKSHARWDLKKFDRVVRESQARRKVIYDALRQGNYYAWDYEPRQNVSERFMRNHLDLNALESNQRFPRFD